MEAKLEAGVRLNQHMLSYGDRPNDYDSVSKCMSLVTIFSLDNEMTQCSLHIDFRNKFGVIHQTYTPNKERELYSKTLYIFTLNRRT